MAIDMETDVVTCDRCGKPADPLKDEGYFGHVVINGRQVMVDLCYACIKVLRVDACSQCGCWAPEKEINSTGAFACHTCNPGSTVIE